MHFPFAYLLAPVVILLVLLSSTGTEAGDWPQILGPHRDGHATGEKLMDGWPGGSPGPAILTLWPTATWSSRPPWKIFP